MEPSTADAVKRVLTTAGVTGAALTLAAAAALPAFADHNGDSDQAKNTSQGQGQNAKGHDDQSKDAQGHDDQAKDTKGKDTKQSKQDGSSDDPSGNNGTVKIHQTAGDSSPHNVPHVNCFFYVSFFGFDNNQLLNISFTGQAPTGKDVPIAITDQTKTSKKSTTPASGAGHDYDGDQGAYDGTNLDLSGLGAPAKQGYHIKLDVATGEPGGHKYKVFWFTPCTSGSTTQSGTTQSGTTPTTGETKNGGTVQSSTVQSSTSALNQAATTTGSSTGGATVLGESISRGTTSAAGSSAPGAQVLGEQASRSTPGLASLPFTGSEAGLMAALGLTVLGGGTALTVAGRRRRGAHGA